MKVRALPRVALLVGALAAAAGLTACGGTARSQEIADAEVPRGTPVEVADVARGSLAPVYDATASLAAEREAVLLAEMAGEVVAIEVEEGDRVVKGQVLARVDHTRQSLELRQASSIAQRVAHDARRNETLIARNMISREAYDRTRYDSQTQSAAVELKRLDVDKTAIRAPYAGVITRRFIKHGQWLKREDQAFSIADFDALQARINVPERSAGLIRPGAPVRFVADALPGRAFDARIERIAPVVDRASGTVAAVVEVDNRDQLLRPGLFVRMGVNYDRIDDAVLMPRVALIDREDGRHVFVVVDGKAVRREVQVGLADGDRVQVLDGVREGDRVVVVGQNALADGNRVEPIPVAATAPERVTAGL